MRASRGISVALGKRDRVGHTLLKAPTIALSVPCWNTHQYLRLAQHRTLAFVAHGCKAFYG